jgi:hypothetical protein
MSEREPIGGETKIVIRWVYITELQKIFNSLQENFEKIVLMHLFHFTFCVFLVSEKLVSKYEHLLILTDIAISTYHVWMDLKWLTFRFEAWLIFVSLVRPEISHLLAIPELFNVLQQLEKVAVWLFCTAFCNELFAA